MKKLLLAVVVFALTSCGAPPGPGAPPGQATTIQALPENLSFLGTSTGTLNVTANGAWSAEPQQPWLQVSPANGTGNATVTVSVSRAGLPPSHYAGSILFRGDVATREVVTVYMRFPNVSGNISGPPGQVRPGSVQPTPQASVQTAPGLEYVPGEVIVALEPVAVALSQSQGQIGAQGRLSVAPAGASALMQAATALAADYRLRLHSPISKELGLFVLTTGGKSVAETMALLQHDGRVHSVSPNYILQTLLTPNDPRYREQWHYPQISAPQAWNLTTGATDRVVAVVDSGLDVLHPEFAGRVVPGYDFVSNTTAMTDPHGHGTHVAGTVGAATNNNIGVAGVDWNARIMPVRVLGPDGGTVANLMRGILFSAGFCVRNSAGAVVCPVQRAQVINLSLGPSNPQCLELPPPAERHAVAYALANGSVVVAAAGNDNCNVPAGPAAVPGAIAVSATGRANVRAPYSNWGPEIWIAAPGGIAASPTDTGGILSTWPDNRYIWAQGTSMAAPHVAGVASLMLAANRDLTPMSVKLLLRDTATDLGTTGWDHHFGYGLVHAERAVRAARASLIAHHSDFIVRVRSGTTVVAQTRADPGGNFTLENIPAGSYIVEAGTDVNRNGVLGDPGEFLGSVTRVVAYAGDLTGLALNVTPR